MEFERIVNPEMDQNCYLIKNGKKGFLIDPGMLKPTFLRELNGVEIEYILFTHCHFDHIYSAKDMGLKTAASKKCSDNMKRADMVLDPSAVLKCDCDIILKDGEERDFCGVLVKCIHTPGHTDGGVCYLIENNLFSGDTLFHQSIGRCDLPSGDFSVIERSIKNKIYTLPDETEIYPGHGESTTVGFEKKYNMYVRG